MAFIPVPGVVRAELIYLWNGETVENTLHFHADGSSWTPETMEALAVSLWQWRKLNLKDIQTPTCLLHEVRITDLTSDTAPVVSYADPEGDEAGSAIAASLPNNVTFCVSFRTGNRGRSGRGRNYMVGLYDGVTIGNTITSGYALQVVSAYSALDDVATDNSAAWGIVSYQHNGVVLTTGNFQPVTSVLNVDLNSDSQRRRLAGRGT